MVVMRSDVQVVESSLVTPSEATPRQQLWLSPLDVLLVNRGHTPAVYFYHPAADAAAAKDFFDVARLKESLARALVDFYPLAGRLTVDAGGRFVIDCNAEGALLAVARSDLTVADFADVVPSPELKDLFVPRVDPPSSVMLAVQVTFLGCGGVAFGTALHHAVADATSAFRFFRAWAALCRGGGAMVEMEMEPPCHDRTLLRARSPPFVNPDAFAVFCPKLTLTQRSGPVASKVFDISKDHVAALKQACGGVSTFCALSAHVWRCVCVARGLPADATTRLTLPANVRRRIKPPVPDSYFGNALIWVGTSGVVRDVTSEALADTAGRIRGSVRRMDDDVVRSAIDYFELAENNGKPIPGDMPETELRVISWLGMPVYDADYGWGKPQMMVRAESERSGFVYLINDGAGVQVVVCAEAARLKEFEKLLYANMRP
ncbi:hypothetical protein SETIT_7G281100v2 [Setaria italica]|uniref:Uncharacterized protein n=1 Tax=Setaria italica TaxID=4555 RepID=K3Y7G8_SETIT|nr:putrescine hydroxycinnamoyltransferase 1 [Setaria italica]RCV35960.1 hypothetical protein SETIT_7G281100v2 [Setaria italica]